MFADTIGPTLAFLPLFGLMFGTPLWAYRFVTLGLPYGNSCNCSQAWSFLLSDALCLIDYVAVDFALDLERYDAEGNAVRQR